MRRVFGDGENPMRWSLPLYTLGGIAVKIHVLYVLYIVVKLLTSISSQNAGFTFVAPMMAMLFVVVLLHEYGHCLACRRVGGEADEIIMWPLGGLAMCRPPHNWRDELITVIAGPAVNVVLLPVFGALAWFVVGDWRAAVFNPLSPMWPVTADPIVPVWLAYFAFAAHVTNFYLLAFNVLVPMYPMDGGRIVQCLLWRKGGYEWSMRIAAIVGLVAAGCVAVFGLVGKEMLLLFIALFGGLTCWNTLQQAKMTGSFGGATYGGGFGGYGGSAYDDAAPMPDRGPSKAELKRKQKAAETQAEVDRILEKISREGIASLTTREKRTLKRASAD